MNWQQTACNELTANSLQWTDSKQPAMNWQQTACNELTWSVLPRRDIANRPSHFPHFRLYRLVGIILTEVVWPSEEFFFLPPITVKKKHEKALKIWGTGPEFHSIGRLSHPCVYICIQDSHVRQPFNLSRISTTCLPYFDLHFYHTYIGINQSACKYSHHFLPWWRVNIFFLL